MSSAKYGGADSKIKLETPVTKNSSCIVKYKLTEETKKLKLKASYVISVESVSLNKTTTSIAAGGSETLTATVLPENATDKTVIWTSSDTSKAKVENGVVTAVAVGQATITATTAVGGKTATCTVTVEDPAPNYTVKFNLNYNMKSDETSGTYAPQPVKEGGKVTSVTAPSRTDGAEFDGWYTDAYWEEGEKWDFTASTVTENTTLYARWRNEPYLWFESDKAFTIATTKAWTKVTSTTYGDGRIDCCTDISAETPAWTEWDGNSLSAVKGSDNKYHLYFRSGGDIVNGSITYDGSGGISWDVTTTDTVRCAGSLAALLDYKNVKTATVKDYCARAMFSDNEKVIFGLDMPSITADYAFNHMFTRCKSMKVAPELPAQTLSASCYESMFCECTSLEKAPELPAETLADYCYSLMFQDCTSLVEAPELPAQTLTSGCYSNMFNGCSKLNYIKVGFTSWNDSNESTQYWLQNVYSTGTFSCPDGLDVTTISDYRFPSGWTRVTE